MKYCGEDQNMEIDGLGGSNLLRKKMLLYVRNMMTSPISRESVGAVYDLVAVLLGKTFVNKTILLAVQDNFPALKETASTTTLARVTLVDELVDTLGQKDAGNYLKDRYLGILDEMHEQMRGQVAEEEERMAELARVFRLNEIEQEIVYYLYLVSTSNTFSNEFNNKMGKSMPSILGCERSGFEDAIRKGNALRGGIIERDKENNDPLRFAASQWAVNYLAGLSSATIVDELFEKNSAQCIGMDRHFIEPIEKELLLELLGKRPGGVNILFYGEPGTGKTELAKSLAFHLGKNLYVLRNEDGEDRNVFKRALMAARNVLDENEAIILMDEADDFLNTEMAFLHSGKGVNKGWINSFMDENRHKIIWISNRSDRIEASVMRRFAFSIRFERFTTKQKMAVFKNVLQMLGKEEYFKEDELSFLCEKFSLNAGGIADALRNLGISDAPSRDETLKKIEVVFSRHELAINGFRSKYARHIPRKDYRMDLINASEDLREVVASLKAQKGGLRNAAILLYGMPGTGKTEFVKCLARELEKKLVVKRPSDLLGMFIGETEKALGETFREAEKNEAILFLDEADSFLFPRGMAIRSWERSQTNELLSQMDEFEGLFICATNMKDGLDEAAMRRFCMKIEFKPLGKGKAIETYRTIFYALNPDPLNDYEERVLSGIQNLTHGDISAVERKYSIFNRSVPHGELINALKEEVTRKASSKRKIGFEIR